MKSSFRNKFIPKIISLNTKDVEKMLDRKTYEEFLRKQKLDINTKTFIDSKHFENIFTNKIYYNAMKRLSSFEKEILYLYYYEYKSLNEVCKILKCSKDIIIKIKHQAIQHFINNVKKYQKQKFKKNGGVYNE